MCTTRVPVSWRYLNSQLSRQSYTLSCLCLQEPHTHIINFYKFAQEFILSKGDNKNKKKQEIVLTIRLWWSRGACPCDFVIFIACLDLTFDCYFQNIGIYFTTWKWRTCEGLNVWQKGYIQYSGGFVIYGDAAWFLIVFTYVLS